MSKNEERSTIPFEGGFFYGVLLRIKLILRLLADPRVSPLLKLLPIAAFIYLFAFPDLAIGPFDDAAFLWLGSYLFVELCPPQIVQEHMAALNMVVPGEWRDPDLEEDVIDAEYWEDS